MGLRAGFARGYCLKAAEEHEVISDGHGAVAVDICGSGPAELREELVEEHEVIRDGLDAVAVAIAWAWLAFVGYAVHVVVGAGAVCDVAIVRYAVVVAVVVLELIDIADAVVVAVGLVRVGGIRRVVELVWYAVVVGVERLTVAERVAEREELVGAGMGSCDVGRA